MIHVKKIIIFIAICFFATIARYSLQTEIDEIRTVMVGPGYGLEINGGCVLTALHVAEKMDYPIVYQNPDKDVAIIDTNHTSRYKTSFIGSSEDFIFTSDVPRPGESGMPYTINDIVYGVFIGESAGQGLVAALDETLVSILSQR